MSAIDQEPFPRPALIGAGALIALSLIATATVRLARLGPPPPASAATSPAPLASLELNFADQPGGAVLLIEAATGRRIGVLEPGADGFIRSVMRGLARERRSRGIDSGPPFRLSRMPDGRLLLEDEATHRQINLGAFGPTNRDAFARFLPDPGARVMIRPLRLGPRTYETGCTIEIEHSERSLHAHLELDEHADLRPGDQVQVQGAPIHARFGERLILRRTAHVRRANWIERQWTRLTSRFALSELYEVSFTPRRTL